MSNNIVSADELRLEDERVLWDRFVKSDGWQVFLKVHAKFLRLDELKLESRECENREWQAGYLRACHKLLGYPAERIKTIDEKLQKYNP